MYKIYFKQAIQMLKQNKFISIITIIGMALAIMMVMVIIVTYQINNTSVAPESNRDRTLYLKRYNKIGKDNNSMESGEFMYNYVKDYFLGLKTPEKISAIAMYSRVPVNLVKSTQNNRNMSVDVKQVDAAFWDIMSFRFIEGKPFTQADFDSGIKNAVISESTAKKIFGKESALGKTIEVEFLPYKVVGIVKDVSEIFKYAYGEIWIPYSSRKGFEDNHAFAILMLAKDRNDFDAIVQEVKVEERKYEATNNEYTMEFMGPYDHRMQQLNISNSPPDEKGNTRKMIITLAILLLIPAVNLSSFSLSRIQKRTEEIGIRKAFGAKKHIILFQVLYENLITSLIGGIVGLVLSYFLIIWLKDWLLRVTDDSTIPLSAFVTIPVFLWVFVICFILNILSSGIPAYRASKMTIVNSLKKNDI